MSSEYQLRETGDGTVKAATVQYRFDSTHSRFTIQAFAGGFLGSLGHNPTFAVREFSGQAFFDPATPTENRIELAAQARSLELLDRVRPADRDEIQGRMQHEVLQIQTYPQIRYVSRQLRAVPDAAGSHQYRLRIDGELSLHGVTRRHGVDAMLQQYNDGVRISGACSLQLSDYRIQPVKALAGAIRLQDELRINFDLVAWKEAP